MEFTDYLLLPIIIILGVITSWEDFHCNKIKNKWIVIGFIYGATTLLILFLWSEFVNLLINNHHPFLEYAKDFITPLKNPLEYSGKILLNTLLSLLVSFFLWRYGLLAAGDAKLFFLFSFLLPLKYYWKSYLPLFPSFSLLTNIFMPIFIFILIKAIYFNIKKITNINFSNNISWKQAVKIDSKKNGIFIRSILSLVLVFIVINRLLSLANPYLPSFLKNSIFTFLIFIAANYILMKYFKNKKIYIVFILLFIVLAAIDCITIGTKPFLANLFVSLKTTVWFMVIFMSIRFIVGNYLKITTRQKININELKTSMILGVDEKVMPKIGMITGGGMSSEQIEQVRRWCAENNLNEIEIYKKFPFAIWILLGVIMTILLKGSILVLLLNYFK